MTKSSGGAGRVRVGVYTPGMRGFGGILEAVANLLEMVGVEVQPWTLPAFAVGIAVLFLPLIVKNLTTGKARTLLKRARVLEGRARQEQERQALDLVKAHPMGLVSIADEALRHGRRALAVEAVRRLEATGKERAHLRRLKAVLTPDDLPHTVDAVVLLVERLLEAGLRERAEERVAAALRKFGPKRDLQALAQRVRSEMPPESAPPPPSASLGG